MGLKKSNKIIISKNIFKQKRKLIQIATVKKTLELINSII